MSTLKTHEAFSSCVHKAHYSVFISLTTWLCISTRARKQYRSKCT